MAQFSAPTSLPAKSALFLVRAIGRIWFSTTGLVSSSRLPSSRDRALQKREAETERRTLRSKISATRRATRQILATAGPKELCLWESFPRRLAQLTLEQLRALVDKTLDLLLVLTAGRKEITDRPEKFDRPYTTLHKRSDSCNSAMPAEKKDNIQPEHPGMPAG